MYLLTHKMYNRLVVLAMPQNGTIILVPLSHEMLKTSTLCLVRGNQKNSDILRMILQSQTSFIDFCHDMITFYMTFFDEIRKG